MLVGVNEAEELKALAETLEIPFANLLRAYAVEDLLFRIGQSGYREHLWLRSDRMLGVQSYRAGREEALDFFYRESPRLPAPEKLIPGQRLTVELAESFVHMVLEPKNRQGICWEGCATEDAGAVTLALCANYRQMKVPVTVGLLNCTEGKPRPEKREFAGVAIPGMIISYQAYSYENQVSHDLFEMMEKLELVGDMGPYYRIYRALCEQPLSGRYLLEELAALCGRRPQVRALTRISQLEGYRNYTYMRKRWEQYAKRRKEPAAWEEVLELILAMARPLWESLCEGTVFLGDWMPELRRYME